MIQYLKKSLGKISADTLCYLSVEVINKEFTFLAREFAEEIVSKLDPTSYIKDNSYLLVSKVDPAYVENYEKMCAELFLRYNKRALDILTKKDSMLLILLNKKYFIEKYLNITGDFQEYCLSVINDLVSEVSKSAKVFDKGTFH
jgi:hypothetical protein